MVFTQEDKVLRQDKRYDSRKLLNELSQRQGSRRTLRRLLSQIDATSSADEECSVRTSSTEQCDSGVFDCYVNSSTVLVSVKTAAILSTNCNRRKLDRRTCSLSCFSKQWAFTRWKLTFSS